MKGEDKQTCSGSQHNILFSLPPLCPVVLWQSAMLYQMPKFLLQLPSEDKTHNANVPLFTRALHTWRLAKWQESQFVFLDSSKIMRRLQEITHQEVFAILPQVQTHCERYLALLCVCTAASISGSWFTADIVSYCCRLNNYINNSLYQGLWQGVSTTSLIISTCNQV